MAPPTISSKSFDHTGSSVSCAPSAPSAPSLPSSIPCTLSIASDTPLSIAFSTPFNAAAISSSDATSISLSRAIDRATSEAACRPCLASPRSIPETNPTALPRNPTS